MRIAIVDFNSGLGGHTRTALNIGMGLAKRGHDITFVVQRGGGGVLLGASYPIVDVPKCIWGQYNDIGPALDAAGSFDVVHIYSQEGVAETVSACKNRGLPVFQTICGGAWPAEVLPMGTIISLSHEIKDVIVDRMNISGAVVDVLPARIDTNALLKSIARITDGQLTKFRSKYSISPRARIIMRVARLSHNYERSIVEGALATERMVQDGYDVSFVYIGFVQNRRAEARLVKQFDAINARTGRTTVVWAREEALDPIGYLNIADVVIGTGRSAFEGMVAGKPVVVVGKNGFAGTVDEDVINELAYYNFSGRNVHSSLSEAHSIEKLVTTFSEFLDCSDRAQMVGMYGKAYVLDHLDTRLTVDALERKYSSFDDGSFPSETHIRHALRRVHVKRLTRKYLGTRLLSSLKDRVRT